jgi:LacI family transcriptional regulator
VAGDQATSTGVNRCEAFLGTLDAVGLEPVFVTYGAFTAANARERVTPLLARYAPTAIAASNDLMAFGVLAAAHDAGFVVPRDLSVIGYDGIGFGDYSAPPLTTIANPPHRLGEAAATLAVSRLRDPDQPAQRTIVEPSIVVRKSTAPPRFT